MAKGDVTRGFQATEVAHSGESAYLNGDPTGGRPWVGKSRALGKGTGQKVYPMRFSASHYAQLEYLKRETGKPIQAILNDYVLKRLEADAEERAQEVDKMILQ